ncbi:MAG: ATP-binding protein [Anaerolineae bacterium]
MKSLFEALKAYDLPVGVYVVRQIDGVDTLVEANFEFLRIFGFDSAEAVVGRPVTDLYGSEQTFEEFRRELDRAAAQGRVLHSHHEKLRAANGDLIPLEVHVRADFDEAGAIIGRTGVVVPISDLEMLLSDIGKVLHRYSHTLVNIRLQLDSVQKAISDGDDPFGHPFYAPTYQEADASFERPAGLLARALERLLDGIDANHRAWDALPAESWELLRLRLIVLENYRTHIPEVELWPSTLLTAARVVITTMHTVEAGYLPKQTVKDVIGRAKELEQLICLFDIHLTTAQLLEIEHEVLTARELALYSVRSRTKKETLPLGEIVLEAFRSLENFAQSRQIEMRIEQIGRRARVRVLRRDVVRAVQNLLHNAIKYSWSKPTDPVWIDVHYGVDPETGLATVTITNYGVPILPEEIDSGRIYELGYRGALSGDRSRRGTGIGLYDAQRVARAHSGDVTIGSRPASGYLDEDEQPYITTAVLTLPVVLG